VEQKERKYEECCHMEWNNRHIL